MLNHFQRLIIQFESIKVQVNKVNIKRHCSHDKIRSLYKLQFVQVQILYINLYKMHQKGNLFQDLGLQKRSNTTDITLAEVSQQPLTWGQHPKSSCNITC